MSRTIKFRAWDRLKKQMFWVEAITFVKKTGLSGYVYYVGSKYPHSIATLLEYTGLLDKNGKEIYEGDIVRYLYATELILQGFATVEFKYAMFGLNAKGVDHGRGPDEINWVPLEHHTRRGGLECEIIGNIYENPELLEGGTK